MCLHRKRKKTKQQQHKKGNNKNPYQTKDLNKGPGLQSVICFCYILTCVNSCIWQYLIFIGIEFAF